MRRIASFLLLLSLLITLPGCGLSGTSGKTQDSSQESAEETPPTPEPYTILDPAGGWGAGRCPLRRLRRGGGASVFSPGGGLSGAGLRWGQQGQRHR